ncbi:MAG: hypothetical protein ACRDWV_00565 [Acidimicrobiales bacterium]
MPESETPSKCCNSFAAGHKVHWLQAAQTSPKPGSVPGRDALVSGIDGEVITVTFDGEEEPRRFRNHDASRLAELVALHGPLVSVYERNAVLRAGEHCFSIAPDEGSPLETCPIEVVAGFGRLYRPDAGQPSSDP